MTWARVVPLSSDVARSLARRDRAWCVYGANLTVTFGCDATPDAVRTTDLTPLFLRLSGSGFELTWSNPTQHGEAPEKLTPTLIPPTVRVVEPKRQPVP